jgi:hypothetical protein
MILRCVLVIVTVVATALAAPGPGVSYFKRARDISAVSSQQTNYFVIDQEILQNARPNLSDLRIYDGETQVPYALAVQSGGVQSAEQEAKILNLGMVGDHTEFDLDLTQMVQYNRIRLSLDAKDFLVTANAQGRDVLAGGKPVELGASTLYDFSRESLGSNSILKVPTASIRYLHVRLTKGIKPQQVKEAVVFSLEEKKSYWTDVGSCGTPRVIQPAVMTAGTSSWNPQAKPTTAIDCTVPLNVGVDRIAFTVTAGQVNFRRSVELTEYDTTRGDSLELAAGEISRVQIKRGGTVVNNEHLSVPVGRSTHAHFTVLIANGDDPPLAIERIQPQAVERRIFFAPSASQGLRLYYGDDKLEAPTYDYAKFFKDDTPAVQAQLGPAEANANFAGRPDDRPWSERHKALLWVAMLAAVAGLGFVALRGLKQN